MEKTDLEQIKQLGILEVATRLGVRVKGKKAICFAGHDTDPSLSFVPAKQYWKCFGCGKKGDAITLVMEVTECSFKEALGWFAREFGSYVQREDRRGKGRRWPTPRKRSPSPVPPQAAPNAPSLKFDSDPEVYGWLIARCGEVADPRGVEYLRSHGIPPNVATKLIVRELRSPRRALAQLIRRWGVARVLRSGLAWGDLSPEDLIWGSYSLLFPFVQDDAVIYIQARPIGGRSKFVGLRGIAKPLYNVNRLTSLPVGSVVHLCEGIPDALALEARQLPALAVLGAGSFRDDWVDLLLRYHVVVVPDGDNGGRTFLTSVSEAFKRRGKAVQTVTMPLGRDAADVLSECRRNG